MRKHRVLVVLAAFVLLLSGCEIDFEEIRQIVIEIAMDWAKAHALDVARYTFTGRSGDAEVDAVLGARDVVQNLLSADGLMEEGRAEGNLDKMEQAVDQRPGDYTYRVSYGSALLQSGDVSMAEEQFAAADDAVVAYGGDHSQAYADQGIDELGAMRSGFEKNGFASKEQCQLYYGRMAYFYEIKMVSGDAFFEQRRDHYQALKASCAQ